jgi:hypothetical protein
MVYMDSFDPNGKRLKDAVARIAKTSVMKPYTCTEYRQEMILLGLQRRLADPNLEPAEKQRLEEQIRKIEKDMDMA